MENTEEHWRHELNVNPHHVFDASLQFIDEPYASAVLEKAVYLLISKPVAQDGHRHPDWEADPQYVLDNVRNFAQFPWALQAVYAAVGTDPSLHEQSFEAIKTIHEIQDLPLSHADAPRTDAQWREIARSNPGLALLNEGQFAHSSKRELILNDAVAALIQPAIESGEAPLVFAYAPLLARMPSTMQRLLLPLKDSQPELYENINKALRKTTFDAAEARGIPEIHTPTKIHRGVIPREAKFSDAAKPGNDKPGHGPFQG